MNDSEIAPLAQRLAEENNVDWRRLQGSGANGRIVERDVLSYLARVMAGEEAVDPTPEPLPEGLEAWPDAPGRAAGGAGRPEPADAGAPPVGFAAPESAGVDGDDDLLLAGDDLGSADDDLLMAPEPPAPRPSHHEDLPDLFDDGDGAAAPGTRTDAPDLFHAGDAAPPVDRDEAPDLFDGDLTWDGDDAPAAPAARAGASTGDAIDFDGFPGTGGGRGAADEARSASHPGHDLGDDRREDGPWAAGDAAAPDPGARASDVAPRGAGVDRPVAPASEPASEPAWELDGDAGGRAADEGPGAPVADAGADARVGDAEAEPAATFGSAPATHGAGDAGRPAAIAADADGEAAAAGAGEGGLPLARSRQVLRRHVDFGGALTVQRMLAAETGRNDLAVPALLLLAARRAGEVLDVVRPGVVTRAADGRVAAVAVEGDSVGALAHALAQLAPGAHDDVDLWVADLSGYGLDDAVLDADALQLTLGRVLSDGDDGRVRATLALAGDVPLERGAAFLARVADLVEEPLRLLL